jgi:hypothetical protein
MANEYSESPKFGERVLIVSCYRWEWQQILTLEGAQEFLNCGFAVEYLELSGYETSFIKNLLKKFLNRKETLTDRLELLKLHGVLVTHPRIEVVLTKIKLNLHLFKHSRIISRLQSRWHVIYPGLVEITNDVNVRFGNNKRLVKRILAQDLLFTQLLEKCIVKPTDYEFVLVVNGRYPLNRAVSEFFKVKKLNVKFIEFGSNRQKFQIYNQSPHSMANRQELFKDFTKQFSGESEIVDSLGSQLFQTRRKFDKQANLSWTRKMYPEKTPVMDASEKICTFFPTSEKEFAGVSDKPQVGYFVDQHDALDALIRQLGEKWEIFIRRHPKATEIKGDPEANQWKKYKSFHNVHLIDPDSDIDSYALAMRSALVAHYSSFIGPELISAGHKYVITLGPTQWEHLDPHRHLHSEDEISQYLDKFPSFTPNPNINLLGFYTATFGTEFNLFYWNDSQEKWLLRK